MTNIMQAIKKLPHDRILKIGAESGTSFFFIGTKKEFVMNIDKYSEALKKDAEEKKKKARMSLDSYLKKPVDLESYVRENMNRERQKGLKDFDADGIKKWFNFDSFMDWLENKLNQCKAKYTSYIKRCVEVEEFVPLDLRKVVDMRDADELIEPYGATIIILTGYENGAYWTSDETNGIPLSVSVDEGRPDEQE